ncbi:MAG: YbjN domain-containing protein [Bdellovibrionota bacterium]
MSLVCTPHKLRGYLEAYGWKYDCIGEFSIVTGWQGDSREYPLMVTMNNTVIDFIVNPLIYFELEWQEWPEILCFIMELNEDMSLAKLSINDSGAIVLTASALSLNFGYAQLSQYLEILGHYSDVIYQELLVKLQECGLLFHHRSKFLT